MSARDTLISLCLILMLVGFLGALGCVIADWHRYVRWLRRHLRWQWMTNVWARWAP